MPGDRHRRPTAELVKRAPKVVLHDHLDGGLRPSTIIELADETGARIDQIPFTPERVWRALQEA